MDVRLWLDAFITSAIRERPNLRAGFLSPEIVTPDVLDMRFSGPHSRSARGGADKNLTGVAAPRARNSIVTIRPTYVVPEL